MYIIPNTTIKLIRNCPIEPSYENTIFFNSETEQTNFFINTLEGYKLQNNSYQRVNNNKMRVAVNAEHLYTCNYLAFQNASFGSKWFYAFITNIEYINNVTSEVTYELDVIQTWHFNYLLMPCFVEREHSLTDEIGDNIVVENLETGEYIIDNYSEPDALDPESFDIVLFCTVDQNYQPIGGYWNGYMGSGLFPKTFPNTYAGLTEMITWVDGLKSTLGIPIQDAIVSACIMPHYMTTSSPAPGWSDAPVTTMLRIDGTRVKNNKCLIYPYNFLYVTNYQGKSAVYRYEFFKNKLACTFDFLGRVTPNPVMIAVPYAYKNSGNEGNFDESIELIGFPQMPWNVDAFKAWLAQSASSIAVSGISFVASAIAGTPAGLASAGTSLISQALSGRVAAEMPPQARGNSGGSGKFSTGKLTFGFMNKHVTPEYATIIDDYFNAYGYATRKIKIPYRTSRPEWNYVKTVGCKIDGGYPGDVTDTSSAITHVTGLPASDMKKIEEIYDNGITFWHNPAHVGDYSQDNSPTVPT